MPVTQTSSVGDAARGAVGARLRHPHRPADAAARVRHGGSAAAARGRSTARSRTSRPPTGSARSPTTRCSASSRPRTCSRVLRDQARVFGTLSRATRRRSRTSSPTSTRRRARSPARTQRSTASVPALRDTLRVGYPALGELNAALPTLRAFSREALPGRALDGADAGRGDPLDRPGARAGAARTSCKGLAADLRQAVPQPREAQQAADPGAAPAARAVVLHELGAGAVRRVARSPASRPATRARQVRAPDHAQLRRAWPARAA